MRMKLLAAILALLPMPALADVTARYSAGKQVLVVESDDGGNSRNRGRRQAQHHPPRWR